MFMKLSPPFSVLAAASLVVALSAAQASADTGVAPRPSENPENISQINGQLVEVGNHNNFDYSYRRINVGANPLGAMFGFYGVQGSYAINSMIALRGDVTLYSPPNSSTGSGFEVTASAAIYFKHMYKGLFLEPGIMLRKLENFDNKIETTSGVQTLVGYQWMWDSGLNVAIAMGGGRNLANNDGEGDDIFGNGYARFGYAF